MGKTHLSHKKIVEQSHPLRKNLQKIGAKTREFEAGLLHFPQSYLASMALDKA